MSYIVLILINNKYKYSIYISIYKKKATTRFSPIIFYVQSLSIPTSMRWHYATQGHRDTGTQGQGYRDTGTQAYLRIHRLHDRNYGIIG